MKPNGILLYVTACRCVHNSLLLLYRTDINIWYANKLCVIIL